MLENDLRQHREGARKREREKKPTQVIHDSQHDIDGSTSRLVDMGFPLPSVVAALAQTGGSYSAALELLLSASGPLEEGSVCSPLAAADTGTRRTSDTATVVGAASVEDTSQCPSTVMPPDANSTDSLAPTSVKTSTTGSSFVTDVAGHEGHDDANELQRLFHRFKLSHKVCQ